MKSVPVYVKVTNTELLERLNEIGKHTREIENLTAFLNCQTTPQLYGVSAPDDDILTVGDIVVCGVSGLTADQKAQLHVFLQAMLGYSQGFRSTEPSKL